VKRSTGVVGLNVVPESRKVLSTLYQKTLLDIQIIPEFVAYRSAVEELTTYRLGVVQSTEDVRAASPLDARMLTALHVLSLPHNFFPNHSISRFMKSNAKLTEGKLKN
jgi:hypothetical protein